MLEPGIGEHGIHGGPVAPADKCLDPHRALKHEDPVRVACRSLIGLARLVVSTSRKTLLALPAGLRPTLDVALTDLGRDTVAPPQAGDGETAFADQQDPPTHRREGGISEHVRGGWAVVFSAER